MALQHIIAAADQTEAGRQAARTAVEIGRRSSGRVTLLYVIAAPVLAGTHGVGNGNGLPADEDQVSPPERLRRWVRDQLIPDNAAPAIQVGIAYGAPGIEICRFAEDSRADLIVLGRKQHPERSRFQLGDTGDAVARRSLVPALFVPPEGVQLRRILIALDGTERGMRVLERAGDFARAVGAAIQVVTVERAPSLQPLPAATASAPGSRLQGSIRDRFIGKGLSDAVVSIRSGVIVDEVLAEVAECGCDVLAIGHHRGGPTWAVDTGSTAQRLSHAAPCGVLTIPL